MAKAPFVSLHNHTQIGSPLDGMNDVNQLFRQAADLDHRAIAITDHVLERTKMPITIETELAELKNCPTLLRIGFDEDFIRQVCRMRICRLRFPQWNGKSRQMKMLLRKLDKCEI